MKLTKTALTAGIIIPAFFYACVKSTTPTPQSPIHDTVTVIKTDTLRIPVVPDTPNLKNGLVFYLPFNGNFGDSSGKGNTATAVGGAALDYDMHGYAQGAFNSNGGGARLQYTNNGAYKVDTAFSLSFDVMVRNNTAQMIFLSIVQPSNAFGPTFNCGLNMPALPGKFSFSVNSSNSDCSSFGTSDPLNMEDSTNFIPVPGSWYNMVCTFTKGVLSVYVNGQLSRTVTGSLTAVLSCPDAQFIVGGWWNSDPQAFNGKLDEVRMYNRTLNAKEIAYLARNFQPGSTKVNPGVKTR